MQFSDRLWDELRRPSTAVAIGFCVISIIAGVVTSLYFYEKGRMVGQVAFQVEQVQVFDKTRGGVLPLTVIDSVGRVVENNVYAANVTIWNSGSGEIKAEDVREPFRISVTGDANIIDMSPVFFTRGNADKFSLGKDGEILWQHFDAGEGLKIRIVYVNANKSDIILTGYAVNMRGEIDDVQKRYDAVMSQMDRSEKWILIIFGVMVFLLLVVSVYSFRIGQVNIPPRIFLFVTLAFGGLCVITAFRLFGNHSFPQPPF
jgi:hypothetical protein